MAGFQTLQSPKGAYWFDARSADFFRRHLLTAVLALLFFALSSVCRAEQPVSKEYQLKAAFLYNFTKFVDWPEHSFGSPSSPIVIGIWGNNPFGDALDDAVEDRKVNGREITIRIIRTTVAAKTTHILFVSASDDARFPEIREAIKGTATLTVGESEAFAQYGGMVVFHPEGDKLRFEINMSAANQAGLKVSAQLQKLAKAIRGNP